MQPEEYRDKKFFNLDVEKLTWIFGCLIVPIFAYLIVLEAGGTHFLGNIINVLLVIAIGYAGYLMVENYKAGQPAVQRLKEKIVIKPKALARPENPQEEDSDDEDSDDEDLPAEEEPVGRGHGLTELCQLCAATYLQYSLCPLVTPGVRLSDT